MGNDDRRNFAELAMKKAHNESVLLTAILSYDLDKMNDEDAVFAFLALHGLAQKIVQTGTADHVRAVMSIEPDDPGDASVDATTPEQDGNRD